MFFHSVSFPSLIPSIPLSAHPGEHLAHSSGGPVGGMHTSPPSSWLLHQNHNPNGHSSGTSPTRGSGATRRRPSSRGGDGGDPDDEDDESTTSPAGVSGIPGTMVAIGLSGIGLSGDGASPTRGPKVAFPPVDQEQLISLLSRCCGAISVLTNGPCRKPRRCPQHTDLQRVKARQQLIGEWLSWESLGFPTPADNNNPRPARNDVHYETDREALEDYATGLPPPKSHAFYNSPKR